MRLHRLTLTAFGPFPGTETVDLDELAADGVFLLHGPTGAGKTTVLDAVCFALYGRVPGARAGAGARLRSDHADPDREPHVELEFSVGPRRLRIARSPVWERPKRRGSGTTTAQAGVLVEELLPAGWTCRTTRLDEAGMLVDDLVGLGAEQFTTLVMLPQGEFATFLRADAETRRKVLERLFRTDRFSDVQGLLRERRSQARRDAEEVTGRLRDLLAQARQAARTVRSSTIPSQPSTSSRGLQPAGSDQVSASTGGFADVVEGLGSLAEDLPVLRPTELLRGTVDHVASLRADALLAWEQALVVREGSVARAARAAEKLAIARRDQERQARLRELRTRQAALTDAAPRRSAWQEALEAAAGADVVAVVLDQAVRARAAARGSAAALAVAAARVQAAGVPESAVEDEALDEALALTRRRHDALADALPVWRRLSHARTARDRASRDHAERQGRHARALADAEAAAHGVSEATAARDAQAAVAAELPVSRAQEEAAAAVLRHAEDADRLSATLAAAEPLRHALDREATDARQCWLDLRERRLDGMAAELAGRLTADEPCPVCGSGEHPRPATGTSSAVSAEEEDTAREAAEALTTQVAAADTRLAALRAERDAARAATAGAGLDEARAAVVAARESVVKASRATTERQRLDRLLTAAAARAETTTRALGAATSLLTDAAQALAEASAHADAAARELSRVLRPLSAEPALAGLLPPVGPERDGEVAGAELTVDEATWDPDDGQGALFGLPGDAGARATETPPAETSPAEAPSAEAPAAEAPFPDLDDGTDWPRLLQDLTDDVATRVAALEDLARAAQESRAADRARQEADAALACALRDAGLAGEDEARAALLGADRRAELQAACRRHDDEAAAVRAQLLALGASEDVPADADTEQRPAPDLAALAALAEGAHLTEEDALADLARAETAVTELDRLGRLVTTAARRAEPVLRRLADVDALTRCAEGTGGDNTLRMSLSAFVLAARLEQVAQAASVRLLAMSAGRYSLVHSDGAGTTGRGRSGLSLRVVDAWTGTERDTSSLSGGEAFYASLALALGLADVVREEAGGTTFDTLFIDEGFGSLDPDTLEEVLDTVDDLRSGGRVVGIVSHVGDLRDRIPRRLEVVKGQRGSTLRTDSADVAVPA